MRDLHFSVISQGALLCATAFLVCASSARPPLDRPKTPSSRFKTLATYRGYGGLHKVLIGPGPTPGSERLYRSYIYQGGTLDIVASDPDTGDYKIYACPVKSEEGAWAMAVGPDGKLYVGTLSHAHLLRLDPSTGSFVDLGRPSETESYIWQLAVGTDRRLYGCTYPSCKLVRYDPATGKMDDLGRLDPHEQYARFVAASNDGFVYVGVGTSHSHIIAYEIRTGERRDLLPEALQVPGTPMVVRSADGTIYASASGHYFRLQGWQAIPIPPQSYRPDTGIHLRDGRWITLEENGLRITNPVSRQKVTIPDRFPGKEMNPFRLGLGPDGMLYGSTMLPIHFFRVHPKTGELRTLGNLGGGEIYSFLAHGNRLVAAAYTAQAPLMVYDPKQPFHPGSRSADNPRLIHYTDENRSWRPQAMISGPSGRIYLGAIAGYGLLGGPLVEFDPVTGTVESFPHLVKDQSVVSLTIARDPDDHRRELLAGGTSVEGGGGSSPTTTEAVLFLWDPVSKQELFKTVPVRRERSITDLVTTDNDRIIGIAGGSQLFVFDMRTRRVIHRARLPFSGIVYNAAAIGPGGRVYGLARAGVFTIDPGSYAVRLEAAYPRPITSGFALDGNALYFAAGARIVRYEISRPVAFRSGHRVPHYVEAG